MATSAPRTLSFAATYDIVRHSRTGYYVFNNGWMSVCASKLGLGDDAYQWLLNMVAPGPGVPQCVFDDTNFGEIITDDEDYRKAPEIGAHGAFVCGVIQMLVDPDDRECITIFPALPSAWAGRSLNFEGLAVRGGLLVSAERSEGWATFGLRNPGSQRATRTVRIRLGESAQRTSVLPKGAYVEGGDVVVPAITLEPGAEFTCTLVHSPANHSAKKK